MDRAPKDDETLDAANTGRWTKTEHELFLQGLREFGKDWKQIGSLIKTRTVVQIRTHAQKYFLATKKNESTAQPMTIPPKQVKDKKRPIVNSHSKGGKPKRTREDETFDGLDRFFDLVDAWSSGSDEGTPTALDELEFLRAPSFPQSFNDDKDVPSIVPVNSVQEPQTGFSQPLAASTSAAAMVANKVPVSGSMAIYMADANVVGELPDISATFDPLPPSMEFATIGKWMETINETS